MFLQAFENRSVGITVTFMFNSLFRSKARIRYYSYAFFYFSLYGPKDTQNSLDGELFRSCKFTVGLITRILGISFHRTYSTLCKYYWHFYICFINLFPFPFLLLVFLCLVPFVGYRFYHWLNLLLHKLSLWLQWYYPLKYFFNNLSTLSISKIDYFHF